MKIEISENHMLDLIWYARRYCDGRSTYAPTQFNELYEEIVRLNPKIKEIDCVNDQCCEYWPYAQDGMYNKETGAFDARPKLYKLSQANDEKLKFDSPATMLE